MINQISQKLIGLRVKAAREAAGYSQDQLADALRINDRQTISDIEKGKRAVKADELFAISDLFARDTDFFIDPFAVAGEAKFSWRADPAIDDIRLKEFEDKAGQRIGMFRWLREMNRTRSGAVSALKSSLRLSAQSSFELAQLRAEQLVAELDLGLIPAERLASVVEQKFDIPLLFVDMIGIETGKSVSGAICHMDALSVILINRNEPETRRNSDLAHALFHALSWDAMEPVRRESNSSEARTANGRTQQLANNFAAAMLMPTASLKSLIDPERSEDIAHLLAVASTLRVSPSALGSRLFNLKKIDKPTRDALMVTNPQPASAETLKRFSAEFVTLLHEALEKGRISARKAAKIIDGELSDLRDLFSEHELAAPFDI